jgi:hypothetical protein
MDHHSFDRKYVRSLQSSDLRDDAHHLATEALFAAAMASRTGAGMGALLARVKYADGSLTRAFAAGSPNLARLLTIWLAAVAEKGRSRGWFPLRTALDIEAAQMLYRRVAMASLAYWIDSRCGECHGAGVLRETRRLCPACKGSAKAAIAPQASRLEREKIADMVSELEGMVQAHNMRAAVYLRRRPRT